MRDVRIRPAGNGSLNMRATDALSSYVRASAGPIASNPSVHQRLRSQVSRSARPRNPGRARWPDRCLQRFAWAFITLLSGNPDPPDISEREQARLVAKYQALLAFAQPSRPAEVLAGHLGPFAPSRPPAANVWLNVVDRPVPRPAPLGLVIANVADHDQPR